MGVTQLTMAIARKFIGRLLSSCVEQITPDEASSSQSVIHW
jgi:hypothetical protein